MGHAAAGWYDDGSGRLRYWDGAAWTEHFADTYVAPSFGPAPTVAQTQSFGPAPSLNSDQPAWDPHLDPFAAPPRYAAPSPTASAPRKSVAGWVIALIIGSVVVVLGGIVAIIYFASNVTTDRFDQIPAPDEGTTSIPAEIDDAYLGLDEAYRSDSCPDLLAATTQNYRESLGIDSETCDGAFELDEAAEGFFSYTTAGAIAGDTATLDVFESYIGGDEDLDGYAYYTLVLVDGEWLFDSLSYAAP